jgi:hypothetical protein
MHNDPSTQSVAAEPVAVRATGPRTEAGKAISSQNARKHGLCSRTLRLSPEEWSEYNDMRDRYARDLQPADDIDETLIDEICFNYWRLQQTRDAELGIIEKHPTELPIIALYIRYRTGYERAFYKALDQIQKRQRDRRKQAASLSPVRSAESHPSPAAVRSVDSASAEIQSLTRRLEQHVADSRVRSADSSGLADSLDQFVSQSPDTPSQRRINILKKVA